MHTFENGFCKTLNGVPGLVVLHSGSTPLRCPFYFMRYVILMEAIGKVPGGRFVKLAETTDRRQLARLVRAVKKAGKTPGQISVK